MAKNESIDPLLKALRALGGRAAIEIAQAADARALEYLRVRYLGKKSEFTGLMSQVGRLPEDKRPQAGKISNEIKQELSEAIAARRDSFAAEDRSRRLAGETIDVSLPGRPALRGSIHPLTQGLREIIAIFREMGFEVASGPDLEDEYHNFEALNIPANHPARDMQDTFYLEGGGVLRTHTSPVQIRAMKGRKPPLAVVAPGRVYRCDADMTHSPMFTQIEGFMVDVDVRMSDLKGTLRHLINRYFGEDRPIRFRPSFFPFTEPSAEVDVLWRNANGKEEWLEVLGAGMIHPQVLENVGYDPQKLSGFAFGLGIERFVMLKHGITNIRLFCENDLKFLRQF
jgi:phenylalanyl-tRNA synthetase alpha chain